MNPRQNDNDNKKKPTAVNPARISVTHKISQTSLSGKDINSPAVSAVVCDATFKGVGDLAKLSNSQPVVLISVGREYHEDDKLKSTIDLINAYEKELRAKGMLGFHKITILPAGTLQRHDFFQFVLEMKPDELATLLKGDDITAILRRGRNVEGNLAFALAKRFYTHALKAEKAYIHRNKALFKQLTMEHEFKRWGHYVPKHHLLDQEEKDTARITATQTHYVVQVKKVIELYCTNESGFAKAVDLTAENFLKHKLDKISEAAEKIKKARPDLAHVNFEDVARWASRHYINEECPVLIPILSQLGHTSIFYPGEMTPALKFTNNYYEQNPDSAYPDLKLADWVEIRMKNRNVEKMEQQEVIHGSSRNITSAPVHYSSGLARRHSFPGVTNGMFSPLGEAFEELSDEESSASIRPAVSPNPSTALTTSAVRAVSPLRSNTIFVKMQTGQQSAEVEKALETLRRSGVRIRVGGKS